MKKNRKSEKVGNLKKQKFRKSRTSEKSRKWEKVDNQKK